MSRADISWIKDLGEGAWGKVSKAEYSNLDDCYKVAVKTLDEACDWDDPLQPVDMVAQEAVAMNALDDIDGVPVLLVSLQMNP